MWSKNDLSGRGKAPARALLNRIDIVGGSTGYHRYILVDEFIRRFGEWMLVGTKTTVTWGLGLFDLTNQYVVVGVDGGILSLTLFLVVIFMLFR